MRAMRYLRVLALLLLLPKAGLAYEALPAGLVSLESADGQRMFLEAQARAAYWRLSAHYETQQNQAFCGIASLVMVLNAAQVAAPAPAGFAPYRFFTQADVFPQNGAEIFSADWVAHHGLTLDQLGALAGHAGLRVAVTHATAGGLAAFREAAAQALATPGRYVLVNFKRGALGEEGYGHISPLGAYDKETDRFLILDVARYKYPPGWVSAAALYAAMATPDPSNGNKMRGYVVAQAP